MEKPYEIYKVVICKICGEQCDEYVSFNHIAKPDCESCSLYKTWKKSGLTIREYIIKDAEEFEKEQESVDTSPIIWR